METSASFEVRLAPSSYPTAKAAHVVNSVEKFLQVKIHNRSVTRCHIFLRATPPDAPNVPDEIHTTDV